MEQSYEHDLAAKFQAAKTAYESALEQKQVLTGQIGENRKLKNTLQKVSFRGEMRGSK